jgi:hypothetical protein
VNGQSGQTLVVFAVVLALFFTGMIALVSDLGAVFIAYTRADDAALLGAQAGAAAIDERSVYGGNLSLDPGEARRRCESALLSSDVLGDCRATSTREAVAEVSESVALPLPLPGLTAPVHVRRVARPAYGDRRATVVP